MSRDGRPSGRPLLRNPYLWATLIGIVLVTVTRPLLRHEAAPAPVLGRIPPDGLPAGTPLVIAVFDPRCEDCRAVPSSLAALARKIDRARIDVPLLAVSVEPTVPPPEPWAMGPWRMPPLSQPQTCALALAAFASEMGDASCERLGEVAGAARLVVVDDLGRVRALPPATPVGVDEAFHRCMQLVAEARAGGRSG